MAPVVIRVRQSGANFGAIAGYCHRTLVVEQVKKAFDTSEVLVMQRRVRKGIWGAPNYVPGAKLMSRQCGIGFAKICRTVMSEAMDRLAGSSGSRIVVQIADRMIA